MDIYEKTQRFYQSVTTEKRIIGKSFFGRDLYAVKVGQGKPVALAQYAIHGREFITAELAFAHYAKGLTQGSAWLIPLMNPDGCLLSEIGLSSVVDAKMQTYLLRLNGGRADFSQWKANGRGVDLNVNFDANWGQGEKNIRYPSSENYVGEFPFSERETMALRDFTYWVRPDYTLSYHTKGEEIYWYFHQPVQETQRDKRLAEVLARSTGYSLAQAKGSVGGYKDWCIQRLRIPAFTVEACAERWQHPIGAEGKKELIVRNENALQDLAAAWRAERDFTGN